MRPLFIVVFVPSMPMNDERLSTAGSFRMTRPSACCRSAIAANETVCDASEIAENHARVLHREEPLGDDEEEQHGRDQGGDGDGERRRLVAQHPRSASGRRTSMTFWNARSEAR